MAIRHKRPLYCPFCSHKCKEKSALETHMRHHTQEKPFLCVKCKREFSRKNSLDVHLQQVHNVITGGCKKTFKCSVCSYETLHGKSALETHIQRMHTGGPSFLCQHPNCEYAATSSQTLKRHNTRKHTTDGEFLCRYPNCDYRGKNKQDRSQHFVSHSNKRPFSCDFPECSYRAKNRVALKGHQLIVHHGGYKPFACSMCNHITTTKTLLRAHELTHSQEKPLKCDFSGCPFACKTKSSLKHHVLHSHTEKTFKCDFMGCSSTAASQSSLEKHKKYVHCEKPYNRPSCDFRTAHLCRLKEHQVRHNARQRIPCPIEGCSVWSMNRVSLKRHVQAHEATFVCQVKGCSYVGRSSSTLKRHRKIHDTAGRPFHCPLCPKKFSKNAHRSQHLKTHTEEKPVKCPACHYASKIKHNMMRHVRKFHSTAFPEFGLDQESTCDHCHVNFGCAIGLAMHRLKLKTPVVLLTRLQLK